MAKLVSKTYGDALFELALEKHKEDDFWKEASLLLEVLEQNPDLIKFMTHPQIDKDKKVETAKNIFDSRFSPDFSGFVEVLVQKDRFGDIKAILQYFVECIKEYKHIGVAYVATAVSLKEEQKKKVEQRLLETTDYLSIEMHYDVAPDLLGGMVIRIKDRVVDTSVKNKLKILSGRLSKTSIAAV